MRAELCLLTCPTMSHEVWYTCDWTMLFGLVLNTVISCMDEAELVCNWCGCVRVIEWMCTRSMSRAECLQHRLHLM